MQTEKYTAAKLNEIESKGDILQHLSALSKWKLKPNNIKFTTFLQKSERNPYIRYDSLRLTLADKILLLIFKRFKVKIASLQIQIRERIT